MPSKKHMEWAVHYVRQCHEQDVPARLDVATAFVAFFATFNPRFDRERFERACYGTPCPSCGGAHNCRCKAKARTVANGLGACACRAGEERDNCPQCEGTGQRIDFAAIRKAASNAKN